jgi:SOS-response transcriptional repressor LexA
MATPEPKPHQNLSIRLQKNEFDRYVEVLRRARHRNPLSDKTRVIRELLGLEDEYSLLTLDDKAFFKGKEGEVSIYLGDKERDIVEGLAAKESRPFADQARELILEALMQRKLIASTVEQSDVAYIADYLPKPVRLKLLGEIAAGEPIEIYPRSESIDVPGYKLKSGKQYFVLRVRGNSMTDEGIFDGSFIICEATPVAKKGDRVVAIIDGEKATVKKYYPERNKGRIRLEPANKLHQAIYVQPEQLQIQGVVIGTWRP